MLAQPGTMNPHTILGRPGGAHTQQPPMQLSFNHRHIQATAQSEIDLLLSSGHERPVLGMGSSHAAPGQYNVSSAPQGRYPEPARFQVSEAYPRAEGRSQAPAVSFFGSFWVTTHATVTCNSSGDRPLPTACIIVCMVHVRARAHHLPVNAQYTKQGLPTGMGLNG